MQMCVIDAILFPGSTPLKGASCPGHLHVVKHLLKHKANIEAKDNYRMLLIYAIVILFSLHVYGSHVCLWILTCVVDVMLFSGSTSLICASRYNHQPVVKHLLEHKANIEAKDDDGKFLNSGTSVLFGVHVCYSCM